MSRLPDGLLGIAALGCLLGLAVEYRSEGHPKGTESVALIRQAAVLEGVGDRQKARAVYDMLLNQPDTSIRTLAHFKLGTLYLEEVAPVWNALGVLEYAKVTTGVALAKEHLRAALRLEPGHWEARYNLEYAERITPPPREPGQSHWHGSKSSVFATLPSLPGGAP